MLLILGGTGTYFLDREAELGAGTEQAWSTPYGTAEAWFMPDRWHGRLALASRHGWGQLRHTPPFVNSRATIWAAHEAGVSHILSWNGVGAINRLLQLHDLVVLDGVLDGTKTRSQRFESNVQPPILPERHKPFDQPTAQLIYAQARTVAERAFPVGVYACSEGPRLETAAEIAAWQRFGADVVGMTLVPEVWLAQEVGIAFASLCYVTNYAAGVEPAPGAPRFFGVEVAQTCLRMLVQCAEELLKEAP